MDKYNIHAQRGITLLELLLASAVGLLILGAVVLHHGNVFKQYRDTKLLNDAVNTQQFLADYFLELATSAGYVGCNSSPTLKMHSVLDPQAITHTKLGWAFNGPPILTFPAGAYIREHNFGNHFKTARVSEPDIKSPVGDVIVFIGSEHIEGRVLNHYATQNRLDISGDLRNTLRQGDVVIINDCVTASRFQISKLQYNASQKISYLYYDGQNTSNCQNPNGIVHLTLDQSGAACQPTDNPLYQFPSGSEVLKFQASVHFLGWDNDIPTLYRARLIHNLKLTSEPLLNNIINLRSGIYLNRDNTSNPIAALQFNDNTLFKNPSTPIIQALDVHALYTAGFDNNIDPQTIQQTLDGQFPDQQLNLINCYKVKVRNIACPKLSKNYQLTNQRLFTLSNSLIINNGN